MLNINMDEVWCLVRHTSETIWSAMVHGHGDGRRQLASEERRCRKHPRKEHFNPEATGPDRRRERDELGAVRGKRGR